MSTLPVHGLVNVPLPATQFAAGIVALRDLPLTRHAVLRTVKL